MSYRLVDCLLAGTRWNWFCSWFRRQWLAALIVFRHCGFLPFIIMNIQLGASSFFPRRFCYTRLLRWFCTVFLWCSISCPLASSQLACMTYTWRCMYSLGPLMTVRNMQSDLYFRTVHVVIFILFKTNSWTPFLIYIILIPFVHGVLSVGFFYLLDLFGR
jgi:hypothetical protein